MQRPLWFLFLVAPFFFGIPAHASLHQFAKGKRYGCRDAEYKTIIQPRYQEIRCRSPKHTFIAKKENKWGLIDLQEKELLPFVYEGIEFVYMAHYTADLNYMLIKLKGRWNFLHRSSGMFLLPFSYDEIETKGMGIFALRLGEKLGLYDLPKRKMILPVEYDRYSCGVFGNFTRERPVCPIKKDGGLYALFHAKGIFLTPFKYNGIDLLNVGRGYIPYVVGDKKGLLNLHGREVLPPLYHEHDYYFKTSDWITVTRNKKIGLYDIKEEKERIPPLYKRLDIYESISHDLIFAMNEKDQWGVLDKENKQRIPFDYEDASFEVNGLVFLKKKGKWGAINFTHQKVVVPFEYDEIKAIYNNFPKNSLAPARYAYNAILAKKNGLWGTLSEKGEEMISPQYDHLFVFYKEQAIVQKKGLFYAINPQGRVLVPLQKDLKLEYLSDFTQNQALAKSNGKFGIITHDSQIFIPFEYEDIGQEKRYWFGIKNFKHFIPVTQGGQIGFLHPSGKKMIPPKYEKTGFLYYQSELGMYIHYFFQINGLVAVKYKGKWGLIDQQDRPILPFEYEKIYYPFRSSSIVRVVHSKKGTQYFNTKTQQFLLKP
jgi:hypothetical protein